MPDSHTHEWLIALEGEWPDIRAVGFCTRDGGMDGPKTCHLSQEDIERRLNATENLSADTAGVAAQVFRIGVNADLIRPFGDYDPLRIFEALADYAAAREGEDAPE